MRASRLGQSRIEWLVALLVVGSMAACRPGEEQSAGRVTRPVVQGSGTVAFAHHSLFVEQNATVLGHVAVRDQSAPQYVGDDAEMTIGIDVSVTGDVREDTVRLKSGASVQGPVTGNSLVLGDNVTLSKPFASPLALPLADLTPAMPSFSPGTQAVTVAGQATQVLGPGAYGEVKLLLARVAATIPAAGRFRPDDRLLAFLESL